MTNVRELILSVVVILLVVIFGIKQVSGIAVEFKNNLMTKKEKTAMVEDLKMKVDTIEAANQKLQEQQDILKPFFKQDLAPADSMASFGGMFEDMVDYIKINGLLLRAIEYNLNPEQDLIFKNFATSYNVCEVKLHIIGTYPQIQGFFRDIFMYPYYINLADINIMPYESNKKYLIAQVSIMLYSKK